MYLADYHCHSNLSPDGNETISEMAAAAIAAGIDELCVTDHYDIGKHADPAYRHDLREAVTQIDAARERYGGKIILRLGVELGQATHDTAKSEEIVSTPELDFIIGSIHNMHNTTDFYYLSYRNEANCRALLERYFDELLELCEWGRFDVLGHLTYPLRCMIGEGLRPDMSAFAEQRRVLFKALAERGLGIEINTSGLRGQLRQTLPPFDSLVLYRECGGEIVTVGSDAHRAKLLGSGIIEAKQMLREAGFKYFTVYEKHNPRFVKL